MPILLLLFALQPAIVDEDLKTNEKSWNAAFTNQLNIRALVLLN